MASNRSSGPIQDHAYARGPRITAVETLIPKNIMANLMLLRVHTEAGTVDGMENPIEVMYHWKIYEVSKYISFTNHMQTRLFLTASGKFLDSLW